MIKKTGSTKGAKRTASRPVAYTLKNIDPDLWSRVKGGAAASRTTVNEFVLSLLSKHTPDVISLPAMIPVGGGERVAVKEATHEQIGQYVARQLVAHMDLEDRRKK